MLSSRQSKVNLVKTPFISTCCAVLAASIFIPAASAVPITNPGFETGDFTGWLVSNSSYAGVATSYTATPTSTDGRTYTAPNGKYFAGVVSGGESQGRTAISQQFDMKAGDILMGWSAFDAREPRGYSDTVAAIIRVSSQNTLLYTKNVPAVGLTGSSDWESWSFTAPSDGSYLFGFAVANAVDNDQSFNSVGLLDLAYVAKSPSPVPDSGSAMLLLGCALSGIEGLRRRFGRA